MFNFWSRICSITNRNGFDFSLRYKLQIIGIPIEGATNVFCDNKSVYENDLFEKYQLKKRNEAICFRRARECMASDIIIVHRVDTDDNLADMFTKSPPGWKHVQLSSWIMYLDIPNIY